MNPTDLADVSGSTYTYLMNGVSPAGNWTGCSRRANVCACGSSMARRCRTSTSGFPA